MFYLFKRVFKKSPIIQLYNRYVTNALIIQEGVLRTIKVRGCKVTLYTVEKKHHLMSYYPDFAFFLRINENNY